MKTVPPIRIAPQGFRHAKDETLHAAFVSLIAEGVAVALFLAAMFVWVAIYATGR